MEELQNVFSKRVKNCSSIFIPVLIAGRVEGSEQKGGAVIQSLHDTTDIQQVSNVLLFSSTLCKITD